MKNVDWEDLRHFLALAETGNLALAARRVATSQVTVMRRVAALELALGVKLFSRSRAGHRLMAAGQELFASTRSAQIAIHEGAQRAAAVNEHAAGRIRIVTTELAANWILLPHLAEFAAAHPNLAVEIIAGSAHASLLGESDVVAVRFRPPERSGFRVAKLGTIDFALYRRADSRETRYIGWSGDGEAIGLARWVRRMAGDAESMIALSSFEAHMRAGRNGLGVVGLPRFIGDAEPSLTRIAVPEPFSLSGWTVVPDHIARSARVRAATDLIRSAFGALKAGAPPSPD